MPKDTNERKPTEAPGWPYPKGFGQYGREEKMLALEINSYKGLLKTCTLIQGEASPEEVLRRLKDFITGREIKLIVIHIKEKTRHD